MQSRRIIGALALFTLLTAPGFATSPPDTNPADPEPSKAAVDHSQLGSAQPVGYRNLDNADLEAAIERGYLVIDIRREEEWRQTGIVDGSHTLTLFGGNGAVNPAFVPTLSAMADSDTPVVLICRTGNRTRTAATALVKQLGYTEVYNVARGITHWIAEGRPVVAWP